MIFSNQYLRHLQALTDSASSRIWSVDRSLNYTFFNNAYKDFFKMIVGREPEIGDSALPGEIPAKRKEQLQGHYQKALQNISFEVQDHNILSSGERNYISITFNPIFGDESSITGVACIAHDITDIKKRKILLRKQNRLLRQIAHVSSHETRRPVANIQGLIDLIREESLKDAALKELFAHLKSESLQLDEVIHKIVKLVDRFNSSKTGSQI